MKKFMPPVACLVVAMASGAAVAGPDWVEIGDAGSEIWTAQAPFGVPGSLNRIIGTLGGESGPGDFEDMYFIRIADPNTFSATITSANFNAQLFLFNISVPMGAYGLLANDDESATVNLPRFTNVSTDGTNVVVDLPGDYLIAVSGFNNDPLSLTGAIFNQITTTEVSGPDGPGGFNRHLGWTGGGEFGSYTITLTGADFPTLPSPGTLGAMLMGGALFARRRR